MTIMLSKFPYFIGDISALNQTRRSEILTTLMEHYEQHPNLKQELVNTYPQSIVFDDKDNHYLGIGTNGDKRNELGLMLMKLRSYYIAKHQYTPQALPQIIYAMLGQTQRGAWHGEQKSEQLVIHNQLNCLEFEQIENALKQPVIKSTPFTDTSSKGNKVNIDVPNFDEDVQHYWQTNQDLLNTGILQNISDHVINIPYADAPNDKVIDSRGNIVYRPNHDTTHAMRQLAYVSPLLSFIQTNGNQQFKSAANNLTKEEIECMKIAAFCFRAGRTNEIGGVRDTTNAKRSAKLFREIAHNIGFNRQLVDSVATCMSTHIPHDGPDQDYPVAGLQGSPAEQLAKSKVIKNILDMSHHADLVRCWHDSPKEPIYDVIQAKMQFLTGEQDRSNAATKHLLNLAKVYCHMTGTSVVINGKKTGDRRAPDKHDKKAYATQNVNSTLFAMRGYANEKTLTDHQPSIHMNAAEQPITLTELNQLREKGELVGRMVPGVDENFLNFELSMLYHPEVFRPTRRLHQEALQTRDQVMDIYTNDLAARHIHDVRGLPNEMAMNSKKLAVSSIPPQGKVKFFDAVSTGNAKVGMLYRNDKHTQTRNAIDNKDGKYSFYYDGYSSDKWWVGKHAKCPENTYKPLIPFRHEDKMAYYSEASTGQELNYNEDLMGLSSQALAGLFLPSGHSLEDRINMIGMASHVKNNFHESRTLPMFLTDDQGEFITYGLANIKQDLATALANENIHQIADVNLKNKGLQNVIINNFSRREIEGLAHLDTETLTNRILSKLIIHGTVPKPATLRPNNAAAYDKHSNRFFSNDIDNNRAMQTFKQRFMARKQIVKALLDEESAPKSIAVTIA